VDSQVLYHPVDVEAFRGAAASEEREDSVLVVSRFHPSKKIENAIHLAKLLKQNGIAKRVYVAGNISPSGAAYYNYLQSLAKHYGLEDFVRFELNVRFDRLLEMMRKSKAYLHPLPGEPFGMSTVEAMSAGLVPVVPDLGGHTEFVPEKYQFHTFGQGVEAVARALEASSSERALLSRSTKKYSAANYVRQLQQIVTDLLGIAPAEPVILAKKFDHLAA
jgi:glycosyltransferase involved in cell wall biosynthesis